MDYPAESGTILRVDRDQRMIRKDDSLSDIKAAIRRYELAHDIRPRSWREQAAQSYAVRRAKVIRGLVGE
jgi:hypothetical protein